jgi:hypothetical protein
MNRITLHGDGSIGSEEREGGIDPLEYLGFGIVLEAGYRLRSFFRMIERFPLLIKLNPFLPAFLEIYRQAPKTGCIWPDFDCLEFTKTVEMIGFPGKPRLEIYHSILGVRDQDASEIRFIQMENLLDMPVRLGKLKHIVFGDTVDIFEFETVFTLFEYIDSISWEFSFHGTPKECQLRR